MYIAIDKKAWEAVEKVDLCCDSCELFRIAKQRSGEKRDAVGVSCLKDESGAVKVLIVMKVMIERKFGRSIYMGKLMNVENEWRDSTDASKVEGAVRRIEFEEVQYAMNIMKTKKANQLFGGC